MGRVWFILLSLLLPSQVHAEKHIALLIGNQGYSAKVGPLKNPHKDITLLGAALEHLGFKVTFIKDADYRSTDAAIKRHIASARREGQGAISFIYYSGHGAADPDTKINYLIPVDLANADDDDLWNYSLNLNTVVENLRAQAPNATHYVVFDACRSELNLTRKGEKTLSDKGFVPMAYTPGVLVAYATAPGRTASDLGNDGGIYAKALADEIVKPNVDSMLVFSRVARRVQREIGQDPFLSASTMPEVYFASDPTVTAPKQAPIAQTQPQTSEAERTWPLVKDTANQSILEAFVKQFGDTVYGAMARARIEDLKKNAAAESTPVASTLQPETEEADARRKKEEGRRKAELEETIHREEQPRPKEVELDKQEAKAEEALSSAYEPFRVVRPFSIGPGCKLVSPPEVTITKKPAHGRIELRTEKIRFTRPGHVLGGDVSRCIGTKQNHRVIYYIASEGPVTEDTFSYRQRGRGITTYADCKINPAVRTGACLVRSPGTTPKKIYLQPPE
jgi:uncharacterized caspase-like protein